MLDLTKVKLGRRPPRPGVKKLRLAHYLPPDILSILPSVIDWHAAVPKLDGQWGMLGNDTAGDCTIAARLHGEMIFRANNGVKYEPTTAEAITIYERVTGAEGGAYDPATGDNDNGCVFQDVLDDWQKLGGDGTKLDARFSVDISNFDEISAAIYLLGGIFIGLNLPNAWQTSGPWTPPPSGQADTDQWQAGGWGGHEVVSGKIDRNAKTITVITWGAEKALDVSALPFYCDEIDAVLTDDWSPPAGVAPNHFNRAQLNADTAAL